MGALAALAAGPFLLHYTNGHWRDARTTLTLPNTPGLRRSFADQDTDGLCDLWLDAGAAITH